MDKKEERREERRAGNRSWVHGKSLREIVNYCLRSGLHPDELGVTAANTPSYVALIEEYNKRVNA